jgi:acetyl esterase
MWFFGGGWVLGSIEMADATCRKLALETDCLVISVGFRRAPEAKFPAAVDDCYSATLWVEQHARELNGLPNCIAVGGESSGGNLAAAVALMSRDRGAPPLIAQLLVCPVMARDFSWPSYREMGSESRPSIELMKWFWDLYLKDDADAKNPYAAPLTARDLANLPPAIILTAGCDTLRDEGAAYAKRLQQSGVAVLYQCFPGTVHLLFLLSDNLQKGRQAIAVASQALRSHFADRVRSPVTVSR